MAMKSRRKTSLRSKNLQDLTTSDYLYEAYNDERERDSDDYENNVYWGEDYYQDEDSDSNYSEDDYQYYYCCLLTNTGMEFTLLARQSFTSDFGTELHRVLKRSSSWISGEAKPH